jgi:hypothetical protein
VVLPIELPVPTLMFTPSSPGQARVVSPLFWHNFLLGPHYLDANATISSLWCLLLPPCMRKVAALDKDRLNFLLIFLHIGELDTWKSCISALTIHNRFWILYCKLKWSKFVFWRHTIILNNNLQRARGIIEPKKHNMVDLFSSMRPPSVTR